MNRTPYLYQKVKSYLKIIKKRPSALILRKKGLFLRKIKQYKAYKQIIELTIK